MSGSRDLPPVVWKSNFYGTPAAFELLKGVVDVYVADFKFGNDACAQRLANVDRNVGTVMRNVLTAAVQGEIKAIDDWHCACHGRDPNPNVDPEKRIVILPTAHIGDYKSLSSAHIDQRVMDGANEVIVLY